MDQTDRIPLPTDGELDPATREFLAGVPPFNVWRMLARTGVAREFAATVNAMFRDDWFPHDDRETLLLRTASAYGSTYEVTNHRPFAGMPAATVDAIVANRLDELPDWPHELCRMANEMVALGKLSPEHVARLVEHYGSPDLACRAILLMAWFNMLVRYIDSTGVPDETDPGFRSSVSGPTN